MKWTLLIVILLVAGYFGFMAWTMRDVKTPDYTILKSDGGIEIRDYAPMLIAEVKIEGSQQEARSKGFRKLAAFIFGDNVSQSQRGAQNISMTAPVIQQSDKISMTAPVISQADVSQNTWLIQFVMPAHYTMQTLPKPVNKHIHIIEKPPRAVIALRFSGRATPEVIAKQQLKLDTYLSEHKLKTIGKPSYAFYNPPWTVPFLRRNEILWQLAP